MQKFIDLVEEKSNGDIIIEWKGGPEVIPEEQQPRAVWTGSVDIALTDSSYYATESPATRPLVDMVTLTGEESRAAGIFDWAVEQHEKINLRYLGMGAYGSDAYLWSIDKFEKPQDIAGVTLRGSTADDIPLKALGAKTITVDFGDIYSALERHMVDGMLMPPSGVMPFGSQEIVKYCYKPALRSGPCQMVMNLDKWNGLTDNQKEIINNAMIDMEKWEVSEAEVQSEEILQAVRRGRRRSYYLDRRRMLSITSVQQRELYGKHMKKRIRLFLN